MALKLLRGRFSTNTVKNEPRGWRHLSWGEPGDPGSSSPTPCIVGPRGVAPPGPLREPTEGRRQSGRWGSTESHQEAPEDHRTLPGWPREACRAGGAVSGLRALGLGGCCESGEPPGFQSQSQVDEGARDKRPGSQAPKPWGRHRVTSLLQALTVAWVFLFRLHRTLTTLPTQPQTGSRRSVTCQAELRQGAGGGQLPAPLCSPRPHSPTLTLSFTPTPVDLVSVKAGQRCGRFGEVGRYMGVRGWRKLGFPRASTQRLVGLCSQEGSGWRIDPRRPRGLGAPKAVGVRASGGSHTTFPGGLPQPMTLPPPRAPGSSAPGTPPSA